ncbi:sensor histidine kinase [Ekhidna sp.]
MNDNRIPILLENLLKIAEGNFDIDIPVSDKQDEIEAIAMGIHMLADELKQTTVSMEVAEENYKRYNILLETISDGVLEVDTKGEISYSNSQARSILGVKSNELTGKKISEIFYYKDSRNPVNINKLDEGISTILANARTEDIRKILSLRVNKRLKSSVALITFADITEEYQQTAIQRVHEILKHEKDRQSIAFRIQEEVAQLLSAVSYKMTSVAHTLPKPLESDLEEGKVLLSESIKEIRKIAEDLSPSSLNYGIKDAIGNMISEVSKINRDIKFSLRCISLDEIRFDSAFEGAIYHIIENALTVGVSYSNASDIAIVIEFRNDFLFVDYYDIGGGFESKNASEKNEIKKISDRAVAYEGVFRIDTEYNIGLSMYLQFPVSNYYAEA